MNYVKKTVVAFAKIGSLKFLAIPCTLATSILMARGMSAESFGQYSFIIALIPIVALPVAGGLSQLITREVARSKHMKEWATLPLIRETALRWVILVCFFITAAVDLLIITADFGSNSKLNLLGIAIFLLPFLGLHEIRNGIIKGLGYPVLAELPNQFFQPVILLFITAILFYTHNISTITAILATIGATVLTYIASTRLLKRAQKSEKLPPLITKPKFNINKSMYWGRSLFPFTLIALVGTLNSQISLVMLGILGTDEAVGSLKIAERGAIFVSLPLMIVNIVISPLIVRLVINNETAALQNASRLCSYLACLISAPIALLLAYKGQLLLSILFGSEHANTAYLLLIILSFANFFNVACGPVGQLLSMSGNEKLTLKGQTVAVIINITICTLTIPSYGPVGAAFGIASSIIIWNIILGYYVRKKVGIMPGVL